MTTNCLEGIACPKCGHTESFHIEAVVRLHVTDSGSEDPGGDHYAVRRAGPGFKPRIKAALSIDHNGAS